MKENAGKRWNSFIANDKLDVIFQAVFPQPSSRRQHESSGRACAWVTGQGQTAADVTGDFSSLIPPLIIKM